ncbi:MAG: hypothetical protein KC613_24205, partial [Myxococcales bacterium]|nr:hypothetical protein [Myxococcales bacterium]
MSAARRVGGWLSGLLPPAAWAAGAIALLEVLRTLAVGATELGGAGPTAAFGLAVLGLLGLPLLLL